MRNTRHGRARLGSGLLLALLTGCSMQDMSGSLGSITDVIDSGKAYVQNSDEERAAERAAQLQAVLDTFQSENTLADRDYTVGPDDVLGITVVALEKPGETAAFTRTVKKDGSIALPLAGSIRVAGLTAAGVATAIADRYDGEFLKDPQVTADVQSFRSRPVVLNGAVGKHGVFYLEQNYATVLEVLSMAGGLAPHAGDQLILIRDAASTEAQPLPPPSVLNPEGAAPVLAGDDTIRDASGESPPGDSTETNAVPQPAVAVATNSPAVDDDAPPIAPPNADTHVIDLVRLLDDGDMRLNIPIYGNDILTVPPRKSRYVYVLGYVQRPGAYELEPGADGIRALHAIAMAGGLGPAGRAQRCRLIREGKPPVKIDLTKVSRGVRPPVIMEPEDMLVVGSSWFAKMAEFIKPSVSAGAQYTPVP